MTLQPLFRPALMLGLLFVAWAATGRADEEKAPYKVEAIEGVDTKVELFAVRPIDAKTCVLVGEEGFIARSADAGKTWSVVKIRSKATLRDVRFVSPQLGLAVGDGGKYDIPNPKDPKYLSHLVAGYHVMSGDHCWSSILRTQDGGKTWVRHEAPTNLSLLNVVWLDKQRAVAISGDFQRDQPIDGSILTSEDTGRTWKVLYTLGSPCRAISVGADRQGWIVGALGKKPAKFTHNGREIKGLKDFKPEELKGLPADYKRSFTTPDTWNCTTVSLGDARLPFNRDTITADAQSIGKAEGDKLPTLNDVRVLSDRAWVVGEGGLLMSAERKNKKWQAWKAVEFEEGEKVNLRALAFRDAKTGLAVGEGGVCFATLDAGKTWKRLETNSASNLNGVTFMGSDALIVGEEGTILRLTAQK